MNSLNESQLDYVLFHLQHHVEMEKDWPLIYSSLKSDSSSEFEGTVLFSNSEGEMNLTKKTLFMGREIPILFTSSDSEELYRLDEKGNIIFYHDLLKSAFYLLSGYQELEVEQLDEFGRFPYAKSIQKKLNVVTIPVVNYYFEIIVRGIEEYCKFHSFEFKRKRLFDEFGFFLSHDVDRVQFYHLREVLFKIKQMMGLAPLTYSYRTTFLFLIKGLIHTISPFKNEDPWWNFDKLMRLEKKLGIRSSFFFLKQEDKNRDSRYQFSNSKIKELIKELTSQGFEVGLHGSFDSSDNPAMIKQQADELTNVLGHRPTGIRQHFLRFNHPATFQHQIAAGLKYDCTLGFAEHDGYRNSYCYPFKPYDFEMDEMMEIWEIPLTMMEVSVLNYRKANLEEFRQSVSRHIEEVKKFGGVFSILWHNCRLMNEEFLGIKQFYPYLLKYIVELGANSLTGEKIIDRTIEMNNDCKHKIPSGSIE